MEGEMESAKVSEEAESSKSGRVVVGEKPAGEEQSEEVYDCEEDEEEEDKVEEGVVPVFVPGPLVPLKEQIEKDKEDESLRRWKEKLLGSVEGEFSDQTEPEVKFQSVAIVSDEYGEVTTPLPIDESQSTNVLFTLPERSQYRLKLTFTVLHNIVSGLTYTNTVWKKGLQVDQSKGMLGTFAPQHEPYVHTLDEETTPSGVIARGIYTAKLKFEDDDRRCHMELNYSFEIKKRR